MFPDRKILNKSFSSLAITEKIMQKQFNPDKLVISIVWIKRHFMK